MDQQPLVSTLSAKASYRLGEPIVVTFTVRNTGEEACQFLRWGTPLESDETDFLKIERDSEILDYDGRLVKRGEPSDDEYVALDPGETRSKEVDIARLYPIDRPGRYRATLKVALRDAFPAPGGVRLAARQRHEHQRYSLNPSQVSFEVFPGGPPIATAGQLVRQASGVTKSDLAGSQMSGGIR